MANTVSDVATRVVDKPIEEFEHPKYYNIRQMQLLMAEGRLHQNGHTIAPIKASAQEAIPV